MISEIAYWIIMTELLVIVLAFAAAASLWKQKKDQAVLNRMFHDSINTPGHGLIFFDEQENFKLANQQAHKFLPFLQERSNPGELKEFLNYFFDLSVDVDESLANTLEKSAHKIGQHGFREVIKTETGRLCMIEAQKTHNNHTVLILVDVSEVRQHEEDFIRLNDQNTELRRAIDAATSGIVMTNPNSPGNPIIFANNAFCQQLSLESHEVVGHPSAALIQKLHSKEDQALILKNIRERKPLDLNVSIRIGAEISWFNFRLTPVDSRAGSLGLFIGVMTDITELRRHQDAMSQSQKLEALGQLSAGVAHDFNNILSIIDGYARFSGNIDSSLPELQDNLDKIHAAVKRGAALTQKMLAFSRTKIPQKEALDLADAIREQQALLRPILDASVNLKLSIKAENLAVVCSVDDVSQILMNMVVNARDAMPEGGELRIDVDRLDKGSLPLKYRSDAQGEDYASIIISDTGEGIPEDIQKKIFDPFFTTKEQGKGTGLGLSMVYGLVNQMNGYIEVFSNPGKGSKFAIFLPLANEEKVAGMVRRSLPANTGGDISEVDISGYTVLIAEDEPDLRDIVSNMLERKGLKVLRSANGDEALLLQEEYEGIIDILLTDIVMPGMNGVKLAELFQSLRPDSSVIFMSGYPSRGAEAKTTIPENALFIAKPIEYDALLELVCKCLKDKREAGSVLNFEKSTDKLHSTNGSIVRVK